MVAFVLSLIYLLIEYSGFVASLNHKWLWCQFVAWINGRFYMTDELGIMFGHVRVNLSCITRL